MKIHYRPLSRLRPRHANQKKPCPCPRRWQLYTARMARIRYQNDDQSGASASCCAAVWDTVCLSAKDAVQRGRAPDVTFHGFSIRSGRNLSWSVAFAWWIINGPSLLLSLRSSFYIFRLCITIIQLNRTYGERRGWHYACHT